MGEIRFEIKRHIGDLNQTKNGWKKELNIVSWNGNNAKYDIRDWDAEHEHMSRGITLTESECRALARLLGKEFGENDEESDYDLP